MSGKEVLGKNKRSLFMRLLMIAFKVFIVLIILLSIAGLVINHHLESEEKKVFNDLDFINGGTIEFLSANISFFRDFPTATISIKNLMLKDTLFKEHQKALLETDELIITAFLGDLVQSKIDLKKIIIKKGKLHSFTDENFYSNVRALFPEKENSGKKSETEFNTDSLQIELSDFEVTIEDAIKTRRIQSNIRNTVVLLSRNGTQRIIDIDFDVFMEELVFKRSNGSFVENSDLSGKSQLSIGQGILDIKSFPLKINEEIVQAKGRFDFQRKTVSSFEFEIENTNLSKTVPLLTRKLQKELKDVAIEKTFYSRTIIKSFFRPKEDPIVQVDFKIENSDFEFDGRKYKNGDVEGQFFNRLYADSRAWTEGPKRFRFVFSKVKATTMNLLLKSRDITIHSTPETGAYLNSIYTIKGKTEAIAQFFNNDAFFLENGDFTLEANTKGSLDSQDELIKKTDAHLVINDFDLIYDPANTKFSIQELSLQKKDREATFSIQGHTPAKKNAYLIYGIVNNVYSLLVDNQDQVSSEVTLEAEKLNWTDLLGIFGENGYPDQSAPKNSDQTKTSMFVTLKGLNEKFNPNLSIEIDTFQYYYLLELSAFKTGLHFEDNHTLVLEKTRFDYKKGEVNLKGNFDLNDSKKMPFSLELETKKLNVSKLLPQLNHFDNKLLASLDDLPQLVRLDMKHQGVFDIKKGLLPNTSQGQVNFSFDNGEMLAGKISYEPQVLSSEDKVSEMEWGEAIKTKIKLEGDPVLFNNFFKTDRFFFNNGRFVSDFEYKGNINNIAELLATGNAQFSLFDSEITYKEADVKFLIKEINLQLEKDNANFDLFLKSDLHNQKINMNGYLESMSELIVGETGKTIKTTLDISAPKIKWKRLIENFTSTPTAISEEQSEELLSDTLGTEEDLTFQFIDQSTKDTFDFTSMEKPSVVKNTTKGMLKIFSPDINLQIDTFIYTDQPIFYNLKTGIHLKDSSWLVLDKTTLDFHDGSISLKASVDLSQNKKTPFTGRFKTDELNVAQLMKTLNYLELPSLKALKIFDGQTTIDLDISGTIDDKNEKLITSDNNGLVSFELRNIEIEDFEPLDEIADKFFMKKRFAKINFAPLRNNLTIKGTEVDIPLMEIQSNAINLFVEGNLSYGDKTDLWVSIPLFNLKKRNLDEVPKKRGYYGRKFKIHVNVTSDEDGENKFKIHLTKRKFFKARGLLEQHKADKKKYRKERRLQRRLQRKLRKNNL